MRINNLFQHYWYQLFTPKEGFVTVTLSRQTAVTIIRVTDSHSHLLADLMYDAQVGADVQLISKLGFDKECQFVIALSTLEFLEKLLATVIEEIVFKKTPRSMLASYIRAYGNITRETLKIVKREKIFDLRESKGIRFRNRTSQ